MSKVRQNVLWTLSEGNFQLDPQEEMSFLQNEAHEKKMFEENFKKHVERHSIQLSLELRLKRTSKILANDESFEG